MMENFSQVKVENEETKIIVPITSKYKPHIPDNLLKKWEKILDLCAQILHVPAALIMKLDTESIEVFASSRTEGNPYHKSESEILGLGLYCETVVGKRKKLLVPNSFKSEYWKNNPDVKLGMISYLGLPVEWNDGEIFGTFCVLDRKENSYSKIYIDILEQFKEIVESDLAQLLLLSELKEKLTSSDLKIREAHHRIKNHFSVLISSIKLESRQTNNKTDFNSVIKNITNRIRAFSLIHEKLYKVLNINNIAMKSYISELCELVISNLDDKNIDFSVKIDDIDLEEDKILSIGMILIELINNSVKHAFKSITNPAIKINIHALEANRISLSYEDNGIGLLPGHDLKSNNSFGGLLINSLIKKLHSSYEIVEQSGFKFIFEIEK